MPIAYLWAFEITQVKVPGRPEAPLEWREFALTEDSCPPAHPVIRDAQEETGIVVSKPTLIGEVNWGWPVHQDNETVIFTSHGGGLGLELEYSAQEIFQGKMYDPV